MELGPIKDKEDHRKGDSANLNHQVPVDARSGKLLQKVEQASFGANKKEQHKNVDVVLLTANVGIDQHQTNDQIEDALGHQQKDFKGVILLQKLVQKDLFLLFEVKLE